MGGLLESRMWALASKFVEDSVFLNCVGRPLKVQVTLGTGIPVDKHAMATLCPSVIVTIASLLLRLVSASTSENEKKSTHNDLACQEGVDD